MRKNEIQIGAKYIAKVSGKLVPVKIRSEAPFPCKGWWAVNVNTGRDVRIKTAGRLRRPVSPAEGSPESSRSAPYVCTNSHCIGTCGKAHL